MINHNPITKYIHPGNMFQLYKHIKLDHPALWNQMLRLYVNMILQGGSKVSILTIRNSHLGLCVTVTSTWTNHIVTNRTT
jgi:hypothetical protein